MFKNYFKIALRNLTKYKSYSIINIAGLSIGISISILLGFYVVDDLTFDRFHENRENIYHIVTREISGESVTRTLSMTAGPLVVAVRDNIPEIETAARTSHNMTFVAKAGLEFNEDTRDEFIRAFRLVTDPEFFNIFSFKILNGVTGEVLNDPGSIFIVPEIAETLFGDENPVGKKVSMPGMPNAFVAGIVEAPPRNSHIQYGVVTKFRPENNPVWWDAWENVSPIGYVKLHKDANLKDVENKINIVTKENNYPDLYRTELQPLLDIHLGSSSFYYDFYNRNKNNSAVVYTLLVTGILILLTACINFINLSTARSGRRAREVGMRKVVGSRKIQLAIQFLSESVIVTLISFGFALLFLPAIKPFFENILNKQLHIEIYTNPVILGSLILSAVLLGIISGIYPALIMSSFKPKTVLAGNYLDSTRGALMRKMLVVFQFAVTISLVIGVLIILLQIEYLKSVDMGYDRDQIAVIPSYFREGEDTFRNRLSEVPGILSAGRINSLPNGAFTRFEVIPEGQPRENGFMSPRIFIDGGLLEVLDIKLASGRNFSKEFTGDVTSSVLVNETAVRRAEWDDPLGKEIVIIGLQGEDIPKKVVGVIKDFHYGSSRQMMEPMILEYDPGRSGILYTKLAAGSISTTLQQIEEIYSEVFPDRNLHNFFLDEFFDRQFNADRDFAANIGVFAGIAIFIAGLGLVGLVSYTVEQKNKEIAIRKVLGCKEAKIVKLLAIDFLKWVVIANIIAWPLGNYGMNIWLREFKYVAGISLWPFLIAGAGSCLAALLTMSFQTVRASRMNPAKILKETA